MKLMKKYGSLSLFNLFTWTKLQINEWMNEHDEWNVERVGFLRECDRETFSDEEFEIETEKREWIELKALNFHPMKYRRWNYNWKKKRDDFFFAKISEKDNRKMMNAFLTRMNMAKNHRIKHKWRKRKRGKKIKLTKK